MRIAFPLRHVATPGAALVACATLVLVAWLALSSSQADLRARRLNAAIATGELGRVEPRLQSRLQAQFAWLAHHAGVESSVVVNGPIRPRQLTLLVTTPKYQWLTLCGAGNAIFDPSLNAIFVDESLLWPTEVNVIGTPSVHSMFTVDSYGYVVSYTNFLLAHELGHWRNRDQAAAFFYYGWNDGSASHEEEQAADNFAVRTILAAREAGDEPHALRALNSLSAIGLETASLTLRESGAADIVGGVLLMMNDLLFSSSPFSPYFADRSHPDLLSRVANAVRQIENAPLGTSLRAETALVRAELRRFAALGRWAHREVFFQGPLSVADVRGGALWLGRTDIPTPQTDSLDEYIYRLPLSELSISNSSGLPLNLAEPVKVGQSKVGETHRYAEGYGAWVTATFDSGDPSIELPPPQISADPQPEKDWGRSKWGGLEFLGMAWSWPGRGDTPAGRVTERELIRELNSLIDASGLTMGSLQWQGRAVVVPVVATDRTGAMEFRLFRLERTDSLRLVEESAFRFSRHAGQIDISGARFWHNSWWVPIRLDQGRPGDRVELWKAGSGQHQLFDTVQFLVGEAYSDLSVQGLTRLAPQNPKFLSISGDRAIFGYDNDSLYLVDERRGDLRILFHPAKGGLQVLDLGSGQILFWTLHARKGYFVDANERGTK